MSSLAELEARRGQIIENLSNAIAAKDSAQRALSRAESNLKFATTAQAKTAFSAEIQQAKHDIQIYDAQANKLKGELAQVDAQIAEAKTAATLPDQSTGQTVKDDQAARNEGASPTNPPPGPETDANGRIVPTKENQPTNAQKFTPKTDAGTASATRSLSTTQKIPAPTARPGGPTPGNYQGDADAQPGGFYGGGSPPDDNVPGDNAVKAQLNKIFGSAQKIIAQPNPLDQFASYTYNISLYIMNPVEYKKMLVTKNFNIAGWQLLMQSGGAPPSSGITTSAQDLQYENFDAAVAAQKQLTAEGRNQFFPLDFYIDDLQLKSLVQGRGTRAAHNIYEASFKIYEPNSFTLFDRLYLASQQYTGVSVGPAIKNYLSQNYLMIIRFYGYDDAGNLVRPTRSLKTTPNTDSTAVIEKFFPFQFTEIKTRVQNKITEYECHAISPGIMMGGGQYRGTIPYNVELTSTTVDQLLNGTASFGATTAATKENARVDTAANTNNTTAGARNAAIQDQFRYNDALGNQTGFPGSSFDAEFGGTGAGEGLDRALGIDRSAAAGVTAKPSINAPAKADAAPKTLITGLVDALNKYQEDLCNPKQPGIEPTYTYPDRYEVIIKDDILKNAKVTSPGPPDKALKPMTQAQTAGEAKLASKQKVDNDSQNKSILAGTAIVQLIEQVMRTSSYVTEQQLYIVDSNGELKVNGTPAQTVGWFHIGMEAQPLEYDPKRNDYAYKIIYSISLYAITESKSDWFPNSVYRGTQKRYDYWFTGANSQILNFTQDLNALYYMVASGPTVDREMSADHRLFDKRAWQTRSGESDQGSRGKVFEGAANLADSLYSPADTSRARVTIVGDPDWIQQGEPVFGIPLEPRYGAVLADGSINYESQEPLFQILWNKPVDYDLWTGLMDPGQTDFYANRPEGSVEDRQARVSNVYRCYQVTSMFGRGRFTQDIEGVQVFFYKKTAVKKPDESQRSTVSNAFLQGPDQSAAETARLKAAAARTPTTNPSFADRQVAASEKVRAARRAQMGLDKPTTVGSTWEAETGTTVGTENAAAPPTSGGQPVGPASTSTAGTGGASGTNVGKPVQVNVYLNNGQVAQATSQTEINDLYANKKISAQEASSATNRLRIWQNAANNPTAATPPQKMAKENG